MAGEGVHRYGSDEFESSIASEMSDNSEEEGASVVTRSFSNQFKGTKTSERSSGKPAKGIATSSRTGVSKRTDGGTKKSIVQGQTSSASIRQAVYEEWRRSKENRLAEQQRTEAERMVLQKKEKEDKENYKVKCDKAVEDWRARKREQNMKAHKEKLGDKGECTVEVQASLVPPSCSIMEENEMAT